MPFKTNHFPSKQKPDPVRAVYPPLEYIEPRSYGAVGRYSKVRRLRREHDMHANKFVPMAFEKTRAKEYHESVNLRYIPKSADDKYYIVTDITENRLDLIAYKFYNDHKLWWVIADANPQLRFNPMTVPRGASLRIPSITTLYKAGGVLSG